MDMIDRLLDAARRPAEQERATIVAWLRSHRGRQFTWRERIIWALWVLRHGELVLYGARHTAGDFIERGEHLKEPKP